MDQETAAPKQIDSTQIEFLRRLPQEFEDLVEHWQIVRKRSCPPQELKSLRARTEKLTDQLRDKRLDRLFDHLQRLDQRLQFHVRMQQPLSRTEVETITSIMMTLLQAGIEEVPAELRKRAREQARTASHFHGAEAEADTTNANPMIFIIDPTEGPSTSTFTENLTGYGFGIRVFEDRDSAVRALPSQPPHAVIARLAPGHAAADKRDVMNALREQIPATMPIFWIVDRADWETRLDIIRAGGDGCIQEPIPMASLASRLRKLIPAENKPPHRVLLVNADPEVRKFRTAILRDAGLAVESVDDPMQAMPAALRFAPEVTLVDSSLATMHGLELVHLLRQEDALQRMPIVLLCEGSTLVENRQRFRRFELDYLLHPFSESDLLERLYLRASQYRSMTSQDSGRVRNPSVFLERPRFEEVLEGTCSALKAQSVQAVLFLEVDGYGQLIQSHDSGILGALPARMELALRTYLQPGDVPARYDDAAYAVLIQREAPEQLEALDKSLRQAVEEIPREDLRLSGVRVRFGLTRVGPDGDVRAAMCKAAIHCRSANKANPATGDDSREQAESETTAIRTPTLDAAGRRHWSGRIREAILGKKLFLMFQPIFPVRGDDAIERYEVLLRIREDNGDVRLPSETLAMADQLGISGLLDRWVIDTALGALSTHRETSPSTVFFLKVAGGTIQDDRFLEWLTETVRRRAPDAGSVVMLVREADAVAQRQRTLEMIRRLRKQGIAVGLEHFGLRATSLELLHSLDVDFVKLGRALVQELADESKTGPSTLKLLYQTRARGVTVIASYVENAANLAQLWNERVDLVQGNFLHGPDSSLAYEPVI